MSTLLRLFLTVAALSAVGCTVSENPLYTADDKTAEPKLAGEWRKAKQQGDLKNFTVAAGANGSFTVHEAGKGEKWRVRVTEINGVRYADISPTPPPDGKLRKDEDIHLVFRYRLDGDALFLRIMDEKWIKARAKEGKLAVKHRRDGQGEDPSVIITAGTDELRKFVQAHADELFTKEEAKFERAK